MVPDTCRAGRMSQLDRQDRKAVAPHLFGQKAIQVLRHVDAPEAGFDGDLPGARHAQQDCPAIADGPCRGIRQAGIVADPPEKCVRVEEQDVTHNPSGSATSDGRGASKSSWIDAAFTSFHVGIGCLNLMPGEPPERSWGRVILYVSDVDAMYRRAVAAGWLPATEPADVPWGERYFHLRDPDGNELSFARPLVG